MGMKVNGTSGLTFPDTTTLASAGQASVRAWVNFDGTGTVAIRASFNVTSITDNGTGDYTVNFTTAMPDANYSVLGTAYVNSLINSYSVSPITYLSTSIKLRHFEGGALVDTQFFNVAIFR
jgi:hypothetical protein